MRKTLNINLGGIAFIIDENAFELLHNYLEALKAKFKSETERDEIINDIEARIAEMLNQKLGDRKEVVSIDDVQYVTSQMGRPEDIAGEESSATENTSGNTSTSTTYTSTAPVKRRLFRDPDDAKVGGVISGLCHYFGINDPVWVRLAVVILCFVSFGTMILIYFLLLIVIPKAYTSAEKLQMKGEPVNISTIEKEIKDAAHRTGESLNNLRNEDGFLSKIGHLIVTLFTVFAKIVAGFIIFIGLVVLFALIAGMLGVTIAGNALFTEAPRLLVDNPHTITLFNIGIVLFIAAPVIAIIYAALRAILGGKGRAPWLKWTLLGAWWVGVFLIGYAVIENIGNFGSSGTKLDRFALMQPTNGNIQVQLTDSVGNPLLPEEDETEQDVQVGFHGVVINGVDFKDAASINVGKPELQLAASPNDSFYVDKIITSRGKSKTDAIKNTEYVRYNFSQRDSVLNLPAVAWLDKTGKYRAQNVRIRLSIPEGKHLSFGDNIDKWVATVKGDRNYDDTYFAHTTWTNEGGKVKCLVGENHFNEEKEQEEKVIEKIEKRTKSIKERGEELKEQGDKLKEEGDKLKEEGDKMKHEADKKIIKIEKHLEEKDKSKEDY